MARHMLVSKIATFRGSHGRGNSFPDPNIDGDNIYMAIPLGIDWLDPSSALNRSVSTGGISAGSVLTESGSTGNVSNGIYRTHNRPRS